MANHVHVSRLAPHPANVRDDLGDLADLAASIRVHGVLQPIVVQPHVQGGGRYLILAGHRRYAAAKKAGLDMVPVTVRQGADDPGKVIEIMLVENLQRADLNSMEKAEAMGALKNRGYRVADIAQAVGISEQAVYQYLSLLELDAAGREMIRSGELTKSTAVAAIAEHRKRSRARTGKADRSKATAATWEPDHFTWQHPLAKRASGMCAAREHYQRRRLGKVACGQCWETVIRAGQDTVRTALEQAAS